MQASRGTVLAHLRLPGENVVSHDDLGHSGARTLGQVRSTREQHCGNEGQRDLPDLHLKLRVPSLPPRVVAHFLALRNQNSKYNKHCTRGVEHNSCIQLFVQDQSSFPAEKIEQGRNRTIESKPVVTICKHILLSKVQKQKHVLLLCPSPPAASEGCPCMCP